MYWAVWLISLLVCSTSILILRSFSSCGCGLVLMLLNLYSLPWHRLSFNRFILLFSLHISCSCLNRTCRLFAFVNLFCFGCFISNLECIIKYILFPVQAVICSVDPNLLKISSQLNLLQFVILQECRNVAPTDSPHVCVVTSIFSYTLTVHST